MAEPRQHLELVGTTRAPQPVKKRRKYPSDIRPKPPVPEGRIVTVYTPDGTVQGYVGLTTLGYPGVYSHDYSVVEAKLQEWVRFEAYYTTAGPTGHRKEG